MYAAKRHWVSPEFIGSRNHTYRCCRESAGTGPVVLKVVPVTSAAFAGHYGPINVRLLSPTPTIGKSIRGFKSRFHFFLGESFQGVTLRIYEPGVTLFADTIEQSWQQGSEC